jgi:hypothetical protein
MKKPPVLASIPPYCAEALREKTREIKKISFFMRVGCIRQMYLSKPSSLLPKGVKKLSKNKTVKVSTWKECKPSGNEQAGPVKKLHRPLM